MGPVPNGHIDKDRVFKLLVTWLWLHPRIWWVSIPYPIAALVRMIDEVGSRDDFPTVFMRPQQKPSGFG
jgi:hypothetical protein